MPREGFEPSRREAPPPQDGVSTSFTTWACYSNDLLKRREASR